jgi:hypothetical protein
MNTSSNKEDKEIKNEDGVEEEGRTKASTVRLQRE